MNNANIVNYIDAHIYNNASPLIRGKVLQNALSYLATMDARASGTFTDGQDSPNDGVLSIDFVNRILYDASGNISINYGNRFAYDDNGNLAIEWTVSERLLYDFAGTNSVDFGNRYMYDDLGTFAMRWTSSERQWYDYSGVLSGDFGGRVFIDASGSAASIDYGNRELLGGGNNIVANWDSYYLYDHLGNYSVDWNNYYLTANGGYPSVDWGNGYLFYSSGIPCVDWLTTYLYDSSGDVAGNWDFRQLTSSSGYVTMNWDACLLYDASGNISIDYDSRTLGDMGVVFLNWITQMAYDGNAVLSVAWGYSDRYLADESGTHSLDWQNKLLYDNAGNVVINYSDTNAPTSITQTATDSSDKIATTAFVQAAATGDRTTPSATLIGVTGSGATVSVVGNSKFGLITLTTGTGTITGGDVCTIGYATPYSTVALPTLMPYNYVTANLTATTAVFPDSCNTGSFKVFVSAPLTASTVYVWKYSVDGY